VASALADGRTGPDAHAPWIRALLREYYDKRYLYGFGRLERPIVFRGSFEECLQWLTSRYG
jgi:tRNA 2-selenouridine synthase